MSQSFHRCGTCEFYGRGSLKVINGRYQIDNFCNAPSNINFIDTQGTVARPPSKEVVDRYGYCGGWRSRQTRRLSFH